MGILKFVEFFEALLAFLGFCLGFKVTDMKDAALISFRSVSPTDKGFREFALTPLF
jgi:hypothetical protein